ADGAHRLIDGERRWRAAQKLGLQDLPCDVWPSDSDPRRVAVAGLALNEHRKAHGCLHVARRLRDIKNECAFSHLQVAEHTGLPIDRVKTYSSLFVGSDDLLRFLEENEGHSGLRSSSFATSARPTRRALVASCTGTWSARCRYTRSSACGSG